jgi:CubicO group peptidase (beta-lactamase class C family)
MSRRRSFIKNIGFGTLGLGALGPFRVYSFIESHSDPWAIPRSSPEDQGVASSSILRFLSAIKESGQEFHSFMIIRHGYVIAEGWWYPYSAEHKQQLYSLSKSFTGTAVGFAVSEGLLSVEDPVISFFKDVQPAEISENLAALKVKHLLSMSVGHAKDSILFLEASLPGVSWAKTFLSLPVVFKPGTQFLYNSGASYMLSAIISKLTGHSVHEYLKPRLYEPLNITGATWTENAEGINMGASHLRIRTEDIAKLGLLYLQKGIWNKRQTLNPDWVTLAKRKQMESGHYDNSWGYGYGYQFWLNPPGGFRADGAYGQYSMVFPDKGTVVAITSESGDKAVTMQLVWDKLFPELSNKTSLPMRKDDWDQLQSALNDLRYEPPRLSLQSPKAAIISGKKFILDKNEFNATAVSFAFIEDQCMFTLIEEGKPDIQVACGMNQWIKKANRKPEAHSLFSLRRIDFDSQIAASATWIDEHTLLITFRFIETTHGDSLTCIFDDDRVRIKFLFSAARLEKKPDDRPDITGKMRGVDY